jgi:mutator protein MutT
MKRSFSAALIHNGQLLIVQRAAHDSLPGFWELPGGGADEGEHANHALIREVAEETGITLQPSDVLRPYFFFSYGKTDEFHFLCQSPSGAVTLDPNEHQSHAWISTVEEAATYRFSPELLRSVTLALSLKNQTV